MGHPPRVICINSSFFEAKRCLSCQASQESGEGLGNSVWTDWFFGGTGGAE